MLALQNICFLRKNGCSFKIMKIFYFLLGCLTTLTVIYFADNALVYKDKFGKIPQEWGERVTLISLSPNNKSRILLVEPPNFIDRNFEVRLQHQGEKGYTKIFRSPDVFKPVGSERILWTADGSKFALFGRHFFSDEFPKNFKTEKGDILYFVYDLNTEKLYCHLSDLPIYNCSPISSELIKMFKYSGFN